LDYEISITVRDYLDMVLAFAYGRATNQHKTSEQYAQRRDSSSFHGKDIAIKVLEDSGYIKIGNDNVYVVTEKGAKFMEDHYPGQELWGVRIARGI